MNVKILFSVQAINHSHAYKTAETTFSMTQYNHALADLTNVVTRPMLNVSVVCAAASGINSHVNRNTSRPR